MSKDHIKAEVLAILTRHVGVENAIGMGELYERVYGESWSHRINDTRGLRRVITELRYGGSQIGESRGCRGGGYYLARSAHELNTFYDRRIAEAVKKIKMVAAMKRIGLDEMLGQMRLNLREGNNGEVTQE